MTSLRQNSKENDRWRNIALNVSLFRLNDINATKAQNCYAGFFPCLSQQRNIWHDWNSAFVARDAQNWRARNSQLRFVLQTGQKYFWAVSLNQYLNLFWLLRNCWFFLRISLLSLSAHVHWLCGVCISAGVDEQPKFEDVWGCDVHDCGVLRRWHVFYSSFPFVPTFSPSLWSTVCFSFLALLACVVARLETLLVSVLLDRERWYVFVDSGAE